MLFGFSFILISLTTGLSSFIEHPSRRLELGLYCLSPAIQSLGYNLVKWKIVPRIHYVDTMMFMLAIGILMSSHQNDHQGMRKAYPTVAQIMKRLLGID